MPVSLIKAKAIARTPEAYTTEELDDALTRIVEDDRLSEAQVTRLQARIDPVLRARIARQTRIASAVVWPDIPRSPAVGRPTAKSGEQRIPSDH
jgi:hypothetical protein